MEKFTEREIENLVQDQLKLRLELEQISLQLEALKKREFQLNKNYQQEEKNVQKDNITNVIANNVDSVIGLREALTWQHRPLKITWIFLLALGLTGTIYYIYTNISEYLDRETATKVRFAKQEFYEYPPMIVCPPWWIDTEKALSMGLSQEGLKYSFGYLTSLFEIGEFAQPDNVTKAKQEFLSWYKTKNYSVVADYFESITPDLSSDENSTMYLKACGDCKKSHIYKKYFHQGVCYVIFFNGDKRSSIEHANINMVNRDSTGGLYKPKKVVWFFDYFRMDGQYLSLTFEPSFTYMVKISMQKVSLLPSTSGCLSESGYMQLKCGFKCLRRLTFDEIKFQSFLDSASSPEEMLNFNDFSVYLDQETLDKMTKLGNKTKFSEFKLHCLNECPLECDRTIFDMVYNQRERDARQADNNTASINIDFTHTSTLQDSVITYQEIQTLTFGGFVSNVGGTLGLFLGCTVMTLAQFILSLVNNRLNNRKPNGRVCDGSIAMT